MTNVLVPIILRAGLEASELNELLSKSQLSLTAPNGSGITPVQAVAMTGDSPASACLAKVLVDHGAVPSDGDIRFCEKKYPHKQEMLAIFRKPWLESQIGNAAPDPSLPTPPSRRAGRLV